MNIELRVSKEAILPKTKDWENRFEIQSETSNRLYVVSQHAIKRHWGCSCPSWRTRRKCKHLSALGLPPNEKPFEVNVISG
jgi:hypothetical protein